ncbi:galactose-specific lectin nattectin-like [Fundulus heteroclitus]|uniref:galactose-specific lectin nattectin-like n=1 Tax=Fundulus heteroclitus TaxID=8078 RepID=UPI00165C704B|nr:galactose-specific lectin nattectin-like [Fundulus heteroclitus]
MKFLSVSCFGFICLTLAHVLYLPVTGYPLTTPPGGDTSLPADYGLDWMHGTEGNNPYGFTCPEGWTMHSTQCLLFVPEKMTWEEAKKNCDSKGDGSFAAVYSDTQADEIHQEMKNAGHHDGHVWVGGSKASGDSSWSWGDYSVFDGFAKFCRGESAHHENNCLQISFDGSGSGCLDDQQCDVKLPSVCGIILY